MKVIIQIPCYNEEATLPSTLADLPTEIDGVDIIEIQVIDDGSTDRTVQVAREHGVHHIVSFKQNRGLAAAFKAGIDNALLNDADILVNTDADNQYKGKFVPDLVAPIILCSADVVVGARPIDNNPQFSPIKKMFHKIGSWVLRSVSKTNVPDAASGFRAYSKQALLQTNIFSEFSYCMETLIQAGLHNLKITSVPIEVNFVTRPSRLFSNIAQYIFSSGKTIIQIFLLYRSSFFFTVLAVATFFAASLLLARYLLLILFFGGVGSHFWPSIVLAGVLLMFTVLFYMTGVLSSLIASNRVLSEEILYRLRRMDSRPAFNDSK